MTQQLKEALTKAKANTAQARQIYNNTWKADSTKKNYPAVDKTLAKYQEAERLETECQGELDKYMELKK